MEKGIRSNAFINVKVVKKHLYGISIDSLKEITNDGKTCVVHLNPEVRDVFPTTHIFIGKSYFAGTSVFLNVPEMMLRFS